MSTRNLSIKGKKRGERVALSSCNIEPLNLFIPGGGPILVPKHKAWPGQQQQQHARKKQTATATATIAVEVPLAGEDCYDAEEEGDELEERPAAEVKSRRVSQAARAATPEKKNEKKESKKGRDAACKVDGTKKPSMADAEERGRRRLMRRIREQEGYIAQLKAKYEVKKTVAKAPMVTESDGNADTGTETDVTTADDATQTSSGDQTTDDDDEDEEPADGTASKKVRDMLKVIRIRAAGSGGEGSADGFTPSEDAQILARKEAGESFKMIAGFMKRPRKQIAKRYDQLIKAGKTAETAGTDGTGEGAAADATGAGETMDAEAADAEKTDDTEGDAQVAERDFGGLFDIGDLSSALAAVTEEQAETEEKNDSPAKKSDKANKKDKKDKSQQNKNQQNKPKSDTKKTSPQPTTTTAEVNGGESGYEGGSEAIPDDAGTRLYINQYAWQLLRPGKDQVPEPDDRFDEHDCILLAMADAHLRRGRWEQVQARFANATGRMVPVEVLRYKLGGGDKPEYY